MIIQYPDGRVMETLVLAMADSRMRVAVPGGDDAVEFTNVSGTWISPDCEPVKVSLALPRPCQRVEFSEEDFICSPELAELLTRLLVTDSDEDVCAGMPLDYEGAGTPLRLC